MPVEKRQLIIWDSVLICNGSLLTLKPGFILRLFRMVRFYSQLFSTILTSFLSMVLFHFVQAQPTITDIQFEGLTNTKASYLNSLLSLEVGVVFSEEQAKSDVQTLKNVESIGRANYRLVDSTASSVKVVYEVQEVRTLLPIINFGGLKDNFWFQLGFQDNNWGGKSRDLQVYYQNIDRRHGGQLFYRDPNINGSPWGYTLGLLKYASQEPLFFDEGTVQYQYDLYSLSAGLQRQFGLRRLAEIGLTTFIEDYEQSAEQPLQNPPGPQSLKETKLLTKLAYGEDHRNFDEFYLKGGYWFTQLQHVYNFRDQTSFISSITTYKRFWRVWKNSNVGFRGRFGIATNRDSPFAPFVLDSYFNLRGVGNRIDRGTAQLVFNLEWRQTVFSSSQWAGQLVAFTDLGGWRNPGGELSELVDPDIFRQFVGGGVRLIYKRIYDAALRLDYGVDMFDRDTRGFVLGFGQYF